MRKKANLYVFSIVLSFSILLLVSSCKIMTTREYQNHLIQMDTLIKELEGLYQEKERYKKQSSEYRKTSLKKIDKEQFAIDSINKILLNQKSKTNKLQQKQLEYEILMNNLEIKQKEIENFKEKTLAKKQKIDKLHKHFNKALLPFKNSNRYSIYVNDIKLFINISYRSMFLVNGDKISNLGKSVLAEIAKILNLELNLKVEVRVYRAEKPTDNIEEQKKNWISISKSAIKVVSHLVYNEYVDPYMLTASGGVNPIWDENPGLVKKKEALVLVIIP